MSSFSLASSLHLIFRPATHFISFSDQSLTSSSAVLLFAMISFQDSATTVYTLMSSFSEVCTFLTVFTSNVTIILSEDHVILTYQNSQYESYVSASVDILSAQIILK
ncbi:hypothetical protein BDBG_16057 [Blastomyces gilchristii SLH14081]|uniref:Uncharacterized protein n=1 Tax=Blastomyces gilchristii (strain SLH14081) TaxID=559298 RepID=A0A179U615_BLAGS|nr:uncharacterized protein BDBG_16057 [Blastomyces gilchristii SLH14081]OAT03444.1 hypothetical protein BDBG_16057 [Blastomyces gilchristii SLH14081]